MSPSETLERIAFPPLPACGSTRRGRAVSGGNVPGKRIEAQREIPAVEVYRNDDGDIVIHQEQDSSGICDAQLIELDNERALMLAIALVETVKGE